MPFITIKRKPRTGQKCNQNLSSSATWETSRLFTRLRPREKYILCPSSLGDQQKELRFNPGLQSPRAGSPPCTEGSSSRRKKKDVMTCEVYCPHKPATFEREEQATGLSLAKWGLLTSYSLKGHKNFNLKSNLSSWANSSQSMCICQFQGHWSFTSLQEGVSSHSQLSPGHSLGPSLTVGRMSTAFSVQPT